MKYIEQILHGILVACAVFLCWIIWQMYQDYHRPEKPKYDYHDTTRNK